MFRNAQIDVDTLPSVGDIIFKGLERRLLYADLIALSVTFLTLLLATYFSGYFFNWDDDGCWHIGLISIIVVLGILSLIWTWIGFKYKKYALRERDMVYVEGLLWRSTTVVPFVRIQHAEVSQGPLDRLFRISRLNIYTAGGSASDLTIPGLTLQQAESVKFFILNKVLPDEEE